MEVNPNDPKQVYKVLSIFINGSDPSDGKVLVELLSQEHRTLQQSLFALVVWPLIVAHAERSEYEVDVRNEATHKTCKLLVAAILKEWKQKNPPIPLNI